MKLKNNNHLMYCLNIHPGEEWAQNLAAIKDYALKVKEIVCPGSPFAIGLRLSAVAARQLLNQLDHFKRFLNENGLYVVSINGFPYGAFHGTRVKEQVYLPDWSCRARVEYTLNLIKILAYLLPEGETGTISTVPCNYGKVLEEGVVSNLLAVTTALQQVTLDTGKRIVLCLEPEPDCYLDSLQSTAEFLKNLLKLDVNVREYLGVCLDTCHAAVEFESVSDWYQVLSDLGVMVPKVQFSAALKTLVTDETAKLLDPFNENTYLHQTRIHTGDKVLKYHDLSEALVEPVPGEWRVHFHVPLIWQGNDQLKSTIDNLEERFIKRIINQTGTHIEVETYSFGVLPGSKQDIVSSIAAEMEWAKDKLC